MIEQAKFTYYHLGKAFKKNSLRTRKKTNRYNQTSQVSLTNKDGKNWSHEEIFQDFVKARFDLKNGKKLSEKKIWWY